MRIYWQCNAADWSWEEVRDFCSSNAFVDALGREGVLAFFEASSFLNDCPSGSRNKEEAFSEALKGCRPKAQVALAFHGTADTNVDAILEHGLDPARRRRQVYGPGEYFGVDVATSYGFMTVPKERLLVVVVVMPDDDPSPSNMIVVRRTTHQFVLGTLHIGGMGETALLRAEAALRNATQAQAEADAAVAKVTAKQQFGDVSQLLIQGRTGEAAALYGTVVERNQGKPPDWAAKLQQFMPRTYLWSRVGHNAFPGAQCGVPEIGPLTEVPTAVLEEVAVVAKRKAQRAVTFTQRKR